MKYAPMLVLAAFASGIVTLSASNAFAEEKAKSRAKLSRTTAQIEEAKRVEDRETAECEAMWDAGTHMTKQQWSTTCRRVQNRLQQFDIR